MTIAQAVAAGYGPCSRCHPGRLAENYASTWDGQSGGSGGNSDSNLPIPTPSSPPTPSPAPLEQTEETLENMGIGGIVVGVLCAVLVGFPIAVSVVTIIVGAVIAPIYPFISELRKKRSRKKKPDSKNSLSISIESGGKEKSSVETGHDYWTTVCVGKDKHGKPIYETVYADDPEELKERVDETTVLREEGSYAQHKTK